MNATGETDVASSLCPATMGFVKNCWYVIAFSHEVQEGKVLRRQCCDDNLALFRDAQGEAVALFDRCPHRGVPLSLGRVVGGALQCAYHGFEFGQSGMCIRIPTQETIPQQMRVRSYPLMERGQFIWIWPGDVAAADPSLLPDLHLLGLERPGWFVQPYFMMEIKSNYSMLFDNLLDTTHIGFLHGHVADSGAMVTESVSTEFDGNVVRLIRRYKGELPDETNAKHFGLDVGVPFDRELTSEAHLPNLHVMRNVFTFPRKLGHSAHIRINVKPITPATARSHYHFLTITGSYFEDHPQSLKDKMEGVLSEDKDALEAIQEVYDRLGPSIPEVSVRADGAGMRARRIIARLIRAEQDGGLRLSEARRDD